MERPGDNVKHRTDDHHVNPSTLASLWLDKLSNLNLCHYNLNCKYVCTYKSPSTAQLAIVMISSTELWTEEIVRVTSSGPAPRNSWRWPQIGTPQGCHSYFYVLRNDGEETSGKLALISKQRIFRKISEFSHPSPRLVFIFRKILNNLQCFHFLQIS